MKHPESTNAKLVALFCVIVASVIVGTARAESFFGVSPGPLNATHAENDNSEGCQKCHVSAKGVTNEKCLECHKGNRTGLHATFGGKRCIQCHTQHKGRDSNIIDWSHVGGHDTFDHNNVNFPLSAHHAQVACTGCHVRRMKSGHISYLGLSKECESCHKNVHSLTVPELAKNCELCHPPGTVVRGRRLVDWKGNHDRFSHVTFDGKHTELLCTKCHERMNLAGRGQPRGCTDCHKPIHPIKPEMTQCATCHKVGETWKGATIDHSKVGFRLLGSHARLGCKRCHNPPTAKITYTDGACTNCHRKVHDGQFADKPCADCHLEGGRRTTPFSHEKDTKFPLIGFHADPKTRANCIACHPGKIYRNNRTGCEFCHKDVHAGQLGKDCKSCHTPKQRFKEAKFLNLAHKTFPLEGAHKTATCESCHPNGRYKLGKLRCFDCHKNNDVHQAKLGQDCGTCHIPAKGAPKFRHQTMARFVLTNAHLDVSCAYCHQKRPKVDLAVGWTKTTPAPALDRTFPVIGTRCADCHADPHKGVQGPECGQCHSTATWKTVSGALARAVRPSDHEGMWLRRHEDLPSSDSELLADGKACAKCHAGPTCTNCHRTQPPRNHTALFRVKSHGAVAAFDPSGCRVCHSVGSCIHCHRTTPPANHRGAWGTLHGYAAGSFGNENCSVCHRRADCAMCHTSR